MITVLAAADDARTMMGPLAGAYDLRGADAHPAGEDLTKAYQLACVDPSAKPLLQGFWLIAAVVSALMKIGRVMTNVREAQQRRP